MSDEHETVVHSVNLLDQAVTQLVGPRFAHIDGQYRARASRYQEVRDNLAGQQGVHGSHARSMPPLWLDAADWLKSVDRTVAGWSEGDSTPLKLAALTEAHWRPQDLQAITDYTVACLKWAARADELLEPRRRWEVLAPCPACGHSAIYRQDESGDAVKAPALSVTIESCECLNCHAVWGKELFEHLARVLGCKPIEGVLHQEIIV